ncbi:DUF6807 family protein [Mariniflexile sp.]|uniref:DUF6807 family protein n=1 Tax=Mariniflexile sp. TaxID=1979402 RepID=UPI00404710A1
MNKLLILILLMLVGISADAQNITVKIEQDAAYFLQGKDSILKYQIAEKAFNGSYKTTNYIHPLYTLDGAVLTEEFPIDHLHHRGIFWAWHQLYIGNKRIGDGWEVKDFSWDIESVVEIKQKKHVKAIQAEVLWKSPLWLDENGNQKPIVRETTTIKVYPTENDYRYIDVKISLQALEPDMRIGGSEDEKGYGGFSQRIRLVDDIKFSGSKGIVEPEKLAVKAEGWLDISGAFSKDGKQSGLTILCHPDNPGFPNPWILRSQNSMQNAVYPFPGTNAVLLSDSKPTILRYRMLVHKGNLMVHDIGKIYDNYKKL